MIPANELRPLIREMVKHLGPKRAFFEWFVEGLPPAPVLGRHSRADAMKRLDALMTPPALSSN